jgi:PAS domain S-box-containing protein
MEMPEDNETPGDTGDVFKIIFDRIQTGIIVIDPEHHTIVAINNHAEELLGIRRDELKGSLCQENICPYRQGACPVTDLHTPLQNSERILISKTGDKIPVLKTVAEASRDGKTYLIESFVDIRDRKKAEERKVALLAYLNETFFRIRTPLELIENSLSTIAGQVGSGTYNDEDIRSQLTIEAKNLATIVSTLKDLATKAKEGNKEIPDGYIEFLSAK